MNGCPPSSTRVPKIFFADKITVLLLGLILSLLLSPSAYSVVTGSSGKIWKAGYVGARNLVRGPSGQPIYAEVDAFGNVLQQYGEAVDELANAQVMSGARYRGFFSRLAQLKAGNAGFSITRANNKSRLLSANGDILLEADVDFTVEDIATTTEGSLIKSVLVSVQGRVLFRTENRIAFRVAMFRAKDGSDLGSANDLNVFQGEGDERLIGPMIGARVQYGNIEVNKTRVGLSGFYYLDVLFPPCPGFSFTLKSSMHMELQYTNFNPRAEKPFSTWYFSSPVSDTCVGFDQTSQGLGRITTLAIQNNIASVDYYNNFIVDLVMISGQNNRLTKLNGAPIPLADTTEYALDPIDYVPLSEDPNLDLDGDGVKDNQALRSDGQIAVYLNGKKIKRDAGGEPIEEDLLRQVTTQAQRNGQALAPEQMHQGLLKQISETDLLDTDILNYRESNGALVSERGKLPEKGTLSAGLGSDFSAGINEDGGIFYNNPIIWTEFKIKNAFEERAFSSPAVRARQVDNSASKANEIHDVIRPGEFIKTVIINRATGYIGSGRAQIESNATTAGNTLGTVTPPIALQPPNLKIRVERKYNVQAGINAGKERNSLVGFEGSGLTNDTLLVITTEWYEPDGSPLPDELPGYTARLAKVVRDKRPPVVFDRLDDVSVGDFVSQFKIEPGTHTQSIYIPEGNRGEHFYIHINGQPIDRRSDFSAKGIEGILGERPAKYVPFKVAIYDEATTKQLKRNARRAGKAPDNIKPVYNWVYRPEMEFSLFDLAQQQLLLESTDETTQIIDLTKTNESLLNLFLADDLSYVDLLYDLTEPTFDPLGRLSGDRELVFSIGGEEALASITPGGSVRFNNPGHIREFDAEDFLTIQFYQANDTQNVLWEFAFGGIEITTSLDKGSNKAKSFIICDAEAQRRDICKPQLPISAQLLLPVQITDTVQWKVEALEGSDKKDDLPGESDGGSGISNKPFAYGKTQDWKTGEGFADNAAPTESGNGRYQNTWVSQPQFGTDAVYFSFVPDMTDDKDEEDAFKVAHLPAVYRGGSIDNLKGTKKTDVWRHNPRIGYKITVIINNEHEITKTVKMDEVDVIRQEFINHAVSANTNFLGFPKRDNIKNKKSLPAVGEWGSSGVNAPYAYQFVQEDGMLRMWSTISSAFTIHRQNQYNSLNVPNNALSISSAFRNPERNERVGGATQSKHMMGRALDFSFIGNIGLPSLERGILFGSLWDMLEGGTGSTAQANFWQLEANTVAGIKMGEPIPPDGNANGVPDLFES